MSKLLWAASDFTSGVDRGVLYFDGKAPKVWNGLMSFAEKVTGADLTESYFDGQKYIQERSPENFYSTIEAPSYPEELDNYERFDFTCRVQKAPGYEIHLIYNAMGAPQDESWATLGSSIDPTIFTWDIATTPSKIDQYRHSAHFVIDTNHADPAVVALVENDLYGTDTTMAFMPTIDQLLAIFDAHTTFVVLDNLDGTCTITGPDGWFHILDSTTMEITTQSIEILDYDSYRIRSW